MAKKRSDDEGQGGEDRPGLLRRGLTGFGNWRRSRPFWAGIWTGAGAVVIAYWPFAPLSIIVATGVSSVLALLPAAVLIVMAGFMWFFPAQRHMAGIMTIIFSVASFVLSNLGGFLIGMLLGILGGAMAFAWVPDKPRRKPWFVRRDGDSDESDNRPPPPPSTPKLSQRKRGAAPTAEKDRASLEDLLGKGGRRGSAQRQAAAGTGLTGLLGRRWRRVAAVGLGSACLLAGLVTAPVALAAPESDSECLTPLSEPGTSSAQSAPADPQPAPVAPQGAPAEGAPPAQDPTGEPLELQGTAPPAPPPPVVPLLPLPGPTTPAPLPPLSLPTLPPSLPSLPSVPPLMPPGTEFLDPNGLPVPLGPNGFPVDPFGVPLPLNLGGLPLLNGLPLIPAPQGSDGSGGLLGLPPLGILGINNVEESASQPSAASSGGVAPAVHSSGSSASFVQAAQTASAPAAPAQPAPPPPDELAPADLLPDVVPPAGEVLPGQPGAPEAPADQGPTPEQQAAMDDCARIGAQAMSNGQVTAAAEDPVNDLDLVSGGQDTVARFTQIDLVNTSLFGTPVPRRDGAPVPTNLISFDTGNVTDLVVDASTNGNLNVRVEALSGPGSQVVDGAAQADTLTDRRVNIYTTFINGCATGETLQAILLGYFSDPVAGLELLLTTVDTLVPGGALLTAPIRTLIELGTPLEVIVQNPLYDALLGAVVSLLQPLIEATSDLCFRLHIVPTNAADLDVLAIVNSALTTVTGGPDPETGEFGPIRVEVPQELFLPIGNITLTDVRVDAVFGDIGTLFNTGSGPVPLRILTCLAEIPYDADGGPESEGAPSGGTCDSEGIYPSGPITAPVQTEPFRNQDRDTVFLNSNGPFFPLGPPNPGAASGTSRPPNPGPCCDLPSFRSASLPSGQGNRGAPLVDTGS